MSIVKGKCAVGRSVIDVDSEKGATICPSCGSAYVNRTAIENYGGTSGKSAAGNPSAYLDNSAMKTMIENPEA